MLDASDVTICIPTRDRAFAVQRLVSYYTAQGFAGRVVIADGSTDWGASAIDAGPLDVEYHWWKGVPVHERMQRMAEESSTPYVVYSGDDDYLLPEGLDAAVAFLERDDRQDYTSCAGDALWFGASGESKRAARGEALCALGAVRFLPQEGDTPAARILAHMCDFWVSTFCVTRRAEWLRAWQLCEGLDDRTMGWEMSPCMMLAGLGKIGRVPDKYMLRSLSESTWPTFPDWVDSPEFATSWDKWHAATVDEWGDEAGKMLVAGFGRYLDVHQAQTCLVRHGVRETIAAESQILCREQHSHLRDSAEWAEAFDALEAV